MVVTKRQGAWTYGDLFKLPNDGKRYEIIDGELYEMPSPRTIHQLILAQLVRLLLGAVDEAGAQLLFAPLDVFMPGADPVQPDLIVLTPERLQLQSERGIEGAPDLITEIPRPSNARHDRIRKRRIYARGGVREYWLVSPETETIEVLVLEGDEYGVRAHAGGDEKVTSTVLPTLSLVASKVFEPAAFLQE